MNYNQQQSQSVPSYVVNQFARLPDGRPNPLLAQFTAGLVKNLEAIKFDPRAGLTEEDRYLIQERQKLAQQAIEINRQLAEQQVQAEKDAAMAQFKQMAGFNPQRAQQSQFQQNQWQQQPVSQPPPVQQPQPQPEFYQGQNWDSNEYINNSNLTSLDEDAKFFFTYHFTEINNNLLKLIDILSSGTAWTNYDSSLEETFETGEELKEPDPLDEIETDGKQD
jgi:hypothetical protein